MEDGLSISRRHLPHWRLKGSTYFVTWRLASGLLDLTEQERDTVAECIKYFHTKRYNVFGYVVMPDHAHVIVHPYEEADLSQILHTWKSFTAHQINKGRSRSGAVWQDESYDRIIRDDDELVEKLNYILTNPQRRWQEVVQYRWAEILSAD